MLHEGHHRAAQSRGRRPAARGPRRVVGRRDHCEGSERHRYGLEPRCRTRLRLHRAGDGRAADRAIDPRRTRVRGTRHSESHCARRTHRRVPVDASAQRRLDGTGVAVHFTDQGCRWTGGGRVEDCARHHRYEDGRKGAARSRSAQRRIPCDARTRAAQSARTDSKRGRDTQATRHRVRWRRVDPRRHRSPTAA